MGYITEFCIKIMPRNFDSSKTGIGSPCKCKKGFIMLLAHLTEMYTLCF